MEPQISIENIVWLVEHGIPVVQKQGMNLNNWQTYMKVKAILEGHPNDIRKPSCSCHYGGLTKIIRSMVEQHNTHINAKYASISYPTIATTTSVEDKEVVKVKQSKRGRKKKNQHEISKHK